MTGWHKYPDVKPEENKIVLIYLNGEMFTAGFYRNSYDNHHFFLTNGNEHDNDIKYPSHWAELPEAPTS